MEIRHPGQQRPVITLAPQAKVGGDSPQAGRWMDALVCRKLAAHIGASKNAVQRIWDKAGLKPHRLERYMASIDRARASVMTRRLTHTAHHRGQQLALALPRSRCLSGDQHY